MAQFVAFLRRRSRLTLRRGSNFQEPDRSRARKRGRLATIIRRSFKSTQLPQIAGVVDSTNTGFLREILFSVIARAESESFY